MLRIIIIDLYNVRMRNVWNTWKFAIFSFFFVFVAPPTVAAVFLARARLRGDEWVDFKYKLEAAIMIFDGISELAWLPCIAGMVIVIAYKVIYSFVAKRIHKKEVSTSQSMNRFDIEVLFGQLGSLLFAAHLIFGFVLGLLGR